MDKHACFKANPQRTAQSLGRPSTSSSSQIQSRYDPARQQSLNTFPSASCRSTRYFQSGTALSDCIQSAMRLSFEKILYVCILSTFGMSIFNLLSRRGLRISTVGGNVPPRCLHSCHIQSNARVRLLSLKIKMLDPSFDELMVHFAFTGLYRREVGLHVIQNVRSTKEYRHKRVLASFRGMMKARCL